MELRCHSSELLHYTNYELVSDIPSYLVTRVVALFLQALSYSSPRLQTDLRSPLLTQTPLFSFEE